MIITECHEVMDNLILNWKRNYPNKKDERDDDNHHNHHHHHDDDKQSLRICELDWNTHRQDCKKANIKKHSIDIIVGTDVVFSTALVEPLLKTLKYLSHDQTIVYLCLQERCKDSHELLLNKAKDYDFIIQDISTDYEAFSSCKWGKELECCLLKFTVLQPKKNKKKRKRQKEEIG